MWSSSKNDISFTEIRNHHLSVLFEAVKNASDSDIRTNDVYEALEFLQKECAKTWGFALFRQGLENFDERLLQQGLKLINQQFKIY